MSTAIRFLDTEITGASAVVSMGISDAPRRIFRLATAVRVPPQFDDRQRRKLKAATHACPMHKALGIEAPIVIEGSD